MVSLSEKLIQHIKDNPFFLAPMAGITDKPFRSFMKEMGSGILTTELISAKALKEQNSKSLSIADFSEEQRPVGIQIFGDSAEDLGLASRLVSEKNPDFVDLNLGCPVNKITKKGAGSALLKDLSKLKKVLREIKKNSSVPCSLKVRTGWDTKSLNAKEVAQLAYDEGFCWMALHGRTRSQGYSGLADWDYIAEVKNSSKLPIIGNGDIRTSKQALSRLKESGCDGVMIGRGALKNPWIFLEAQAGLKNTNLSIKKDAQTLIKNLEKHLRSFYPERIFLLQMKKFCSWFSGGYPNSSSFRRDLFSKKTEKELLSFVQEYFEKMQNETQKQIQYESFLMRGHG